MNEEVIGSSFRRPWPIVIYGLDGFFVSFFRDPFDRV